MQKFIDYLQKKYNPLAIVTYGSFSDGRNDEYSDFDCMIIVNEKKKSHDDTVIDGTMLDCFIFNKEEVLSDDVDAFLTVYDGTIVLDTEQLAENLKERVRNYVKEHSHTSKEDKELIFGWIQKTLHRMEKSDDEGGYRAISLLWESLPDYFLLRDLFYFGSKKAAAYLREHDTKGYALYHEAVTLRSNEAIRKWAVYLSDVR